LFAQVTTVALVVTGTMSSGHHGRPYRQGCVGHHGGHGVTEGALLLFNNSFRTAKETQHFTITKISLLTLFKEIIPVYTENHTKL
jgi:hypothetical protein